MAVKEHDMNDTCLIWGTAATVYSLETRHSLSLPPWERDSYVESDGTVRGSCVESDRTDGHYAPPAGAAHEIHNLDARAKARLTTWIIDQHRIGVECPRMDIPVLEDARSRRPLSIHERADRLLTFLQTRIPTIGDDITINAFTRNERLLAWSESVDGKEVQYLLEFLRKSEWVEKIMPEMPNGAWKIQLTPSGYDHLIEIETTITNSQQAFVAMWFDESMNAIYENGIRPSIINAGYKPIRIDRKEHNNKIDDQIVSEMRRSRFVVADFTHRDSGPRGGVYYEAGFAHGLNIPVIFTCRKDAIGKVHFDTRQYNHILWERDKLTDFREALMNRISATIGDGPLKKPK